jgi:hypothetical protein
MLLSCLHQSAIWHPVGCDPAEYGDSASSRCHGRPLQGCLCASLSLTAAKGSRLSEALPLCIPFSHCREGQFRLCSAPMSGVWSCPCAFLCGAPCGSLFVHNNVLMHAALRCMQVFLSLPGGRTAHVSGLTSGGGDCN